MPTHYALPLTSSETCPSFPTSPLSPGFFPSVCKFKGCLCHPKNASPDTMPCSLQLLLMHWTVWTVLQIQITQILHFFTSPLCLNILQCAFLAECSTASDTADYSFFVRHSTPRPPWCTFQSLFTHLYVLLGFVKPSVPAQVPALPQHTCPWVTSLTVTNSTTTYMLKIPQILLSNLTPLLGCSVVLPPSAGLVNP